MIKETSTRLLFGGEQAKTASIAIALGRLYPKRESYLGTIPKKTEPNNQYSRASKAIGHRVEARSNI